MLSASDRNETGGYTNPYTFNGVALSLIMSHVVNASHEYATAQATWLNRVDDHVKYLHRSRGHLRLPS